MTSNFLTAPATFLETAEIYWTAYYDGRVLSVKPGAPAHDIFEASPKGILSDRPVEAL